jgi:hypothetical protein
MAVRRSLTPRQVTVMLAAQGRQCAKCCCPIGYQHDDSIVPFIAEHTLPVALGNGEKPDCLLCVPCAKEKTRQDVKRISKADRQAKAYRGEKKAKRPFRKPPEGYKHRWPKQRLGYQWGSNKPLTTGQEGTE